MRLWAWTLVILVLGGGLAGLLAAQPAPGAGLAWQAGASAAPPPEAAQPAVGVAVLMYHHLAPSSERPEEPGVITPERFESHLKVLRSEGYRFISAAEFAAFREGRLELPGRTVLLTFDDGYESNYALGFPLLKKYSAPGIIFAVARYFDSDGKGAWSPHLRRSQAEEMLRSGLVALGGHSYDGHGSVAAAPGGKEKGPWLTTRAWLPDRQETEEEYRQRIRADLERNLQVLESLGVGTRADGLHFALPNGASTQEELEELAAAGFKHLYSTDASQLNRPGRGLVYRLDAGGPHASPEWVRIKLDELFGRL